MTSGLSPPHHRTHTVWRGFTTQFASEIGKINFQKNSKLVTERALLHCSEVRDYVDNNSPTKQHKKMCAHAASSKEKDPNEDMKKNKQALLSNMLRNGTT